MPTNEDNQREGIELAYIAGFVDGEATIGIRRHKPEKPNWSPKYMPYFSVVNTNYQVLDDMKDFFQARVRQNPIVKHVGSKNGYQSRLPCYKLVVAGSYKVPKILHPLLPYLRVKKELAELIIEFCEAKKSFVPEKGTKRGFKRITAEEAQYRESVYQKYLDIVHPQRLSEETPEKGEATV